MTKNNDPQPKDDAREKSTEGKIRPADDFTPLVPPVTLDKDGKLKELRPSPRKNIPTKSFSGFFAGILSSVQSVTNTVKEKLTQIPPPTPPTVESSTKESEPATDAPVPNDHPPKPTPEATEAEAEIKPTEESKESEPLDTEESPDEDQGEELKEPPATPDEESNAETDEVVGETHEEPAPEENAKPAEPPPKESTKPQYAKKMFLVHGSDDRMKKKVSPVIEKLGFELIPFRQDKEEQHTLFEFANKNTDIGFAVVLLSIEDFAYPKDAKPGDAQVRVSQDVVFLLGFLIGKLGRQRVFVLYPRKDNFELPTRYFDVYYTPFDDVGRWKRYFVDRLKSAEYEIPEKIAL